MRYNPNGDDSPRPKIEDYLEETGNELEAESYKRSTYAWNPSLQDGSILRVTKSSIGTFGWCPQQYYLEKFKGLRGEQVDHHIRGLNVHDMMEWFWANFTREQEDSVLNLIHEGQEREAMKLFFSVVPTPPSPYEFGEDEQIEQWLRWQFLRLKSTDGRYWRPVGIEANIQSTRFVTVDGEQIPIHMNGFIDTLFATGEGGFALMELKTGKYSKSKTTAMRKEMAFYKMMLDHSPHEEFLPITHWGWEFPGGGINGGSGATIHYEDIKEGGKYSLRSVENELVKLVKAHIDMEFPPTPFLGKLKEGIPLEEQKLKCNWCDYQEHCEFWSLTDEVLDKIEV